MYYVYAHKLEGEIKYIGKGSNNRAYAKDRRSKEWKMIFSNGFEVEILKYFDVNSEALDYEFHLINSLPNLINKRKENRKKVIPKELLELLSYNEDSPSCLVWNKRVNRKFKDLQFAGVRCYRNKNVPAAWSVMYKQKTYLAHRIILELFGYKLSEDDVVNHIDCNPFNNKIGNLEVCTTHENNKRKSNTLGIRLSSNNKSGVNGVIEVTNINKGRSYTYAMACISINGKSKSRKFSYNKYGKDQAWQLAIEWRKLNAY